MILEEDKMRIKNEEIFRAEISKSLEQNQEKTFQQKLWSFVNSSFGLWLLSSVVVGLIAFFYNNAQLQAKISAANSSTIHKLNTETSHRLQKFKLALSQQESEALYYQNIELAYMLDGTLVIDGSVSPEKPIYIFPEYKDRTINSLLYEMERLSQNEKQILLIKRARKSLKEIQYKLLHIEERPTPNFRLSQVINQKAQAQPESLNARDSILLAEYKQKRKHFEQGELSEYHERIKLKVDTIMNIFLGSDYLKKASIE